MQSFGINICNIFCVATFLETGLCFSVFVSLVKYTEPLLFCFILDHSLTNWHALSVYLILFSLFSISSSLFSTPIKPAAFYKRDLFGISLLCQMFILIEYVLILYLNTQCLEKSTKGPV